MAEQQQKHETGTTHEGGAQQTEPQETAASEEKGIQTTQQQGLHRARRAFEKSPLAMMRHFADEIDRAFSSMFGGRSPLMSMTPFELIASGGWVPAIESFEEDGNIVLRAELPGIRPEDVKVEVVDDELVISGERVHEKHETKGGYYSERQYGCFERRVTLPQGCDPEKVDATFEDGVLKVTVAAPAPEKQKGRKIEVKSKSSQHEGGQEAKGEVH